MNVFVAPTFEQFERAVPDSDLRGFCWTTAGEVLVPAVVCADDPEGCGCRRSLVGISSLRATTVAVVADLPSLRVELLMRTSELCTSFDGDQVAFVGEQLNRVAQLANVVELLELRPGDLARVEVGTAEKPYVMARRA